MKKFIIFTFLFITFFACYPPSPEAQELGVSDAALAYLKGIKAKKVSDLNDDDMYYFEELMSEMAYTARGYLEYKCLLETLEKDESECLNDKDKCSHQKLSFDSAVDNPERLINLLKVYTVEDIMIYKSQYSNSKFVNAFNKIECGMPDEVSKNIDKAHEALGERAVKLYEEIGKIIADNIVIKVSNG